MSQKSEICKTKVDTVSVIKTPNRIELQQIALHDLSDIEFNDVMNPLKGYPKEPCAFLVNNTTLPTGTPMIDC